MDSLKVDSTGPKRPSRAWLERLQILAVATSIVSVVFAVRQNTPEPTRTTYEPTGFESDVAYHVDIDKRIHLLQESVRRLSQNQSGKTVPNANVATIEQLRAVASRQDHLEKVLTDQPLRALEIPLLRRDLDQQAKQIEALSAALQKAQEGQWDTMKWIIGALIAAVSAICIPIAARLFQGRSQTTT